MQAHYTTDDIAGRIVAALRKVMGDKAPLTPDVLAQMDHFHGGGIASTRDLVAALQPQAGERILDIGSGIGGPARWIASTFSCHVTGIDLTPAFCRAAELLNEVTGLVEQVRIVEGSALAMPFGDGSFDRAYSQNVVMNIADKPGFYREASRVLKPGGLLALSNVAPVPTVRLTFRSRGRRRRTRASCRHRPRRGTISSAPDSKSSVSRIPRPKPLPPARH